MWSTSSSGCSAARQSAHESGGGGGSRVLCPPRASRLANRPPTAPPCCQEHPTQNGAYPCPCPHDPNGACPVAPQWSDYAPCPQWRPMGLEVAFADRAASACRPTTTSLGSAPAQASAVTKMCVRFPRSATWLTTVLLPWACPRPPVPRQLPVSGQFVWDCTVIPTP